MKDLCLALRLDVVSSRVRARARKNAFLLRAAEERLVDLLTIPVVHTGGVSRPLYTSKYWGPSDSEEEPEEEEEAEVEMLQHENVIDFTSLQAEELVPRAKLWTPTSKAKASARAAQGASSSSYLPSSLVSTFDPLRFFHPPPGCETDPSKRPTVRAVQCSFLQQRRFFWHQIICTRRGAVQ